MPLPPKAELERSPVVFRHGMRADNEKYPHDFAKLKWRLRRRCGPSMMPPSIAFWEHRWFGLLPARHALRRA